MKKKRKPKQKPKPKPKQKLDLSKGYILDNDGNVLREAVRGVGESLRTKAIREGRLKPTPEHVVQAAIARHKELQAGRRDAS